MQQNERGLNGCFQRAVIVLRFGQKSSIANNRGVSGFSWPDPPTACLGKKRSADEKRVQDCRRESKGQESKGQATVIRY